MRLTAQAADTYAILVGVEVYADSNWSLAGPATAAMQMAAWLLRQNVPAVNITLFANFSEAPGAAPGSARDLLYQEMQKNGISIQSPTRAALEDALRPDKLPNISVPSATLIVYFCGHGVSERWKSRRFAITADANAYSYEAIDIEFQAAILRSHAKAARFRQQWFIQDACGQLSTDKINPKVLGGNLPSNSAAVAEQWCLYAARPGEFAATAPKGATVFTDALLNILEGMRLGAIDLDSVFAQLEQSFSGTAQHPLINRFNEYQAQSSIVPLAPTAVPGIVELIEMLRPLPLNLAMRQAVYADILHDYSTPAPGDWQAFFTRLAGIFLEDVSGLKAVELFAVRLESYCARHATSSSDAGEKTLYAHIGAGLSAWIDRFPRISNGAGVLAERRRLQRIARQAAIAPSIVLDVGKDDEGGEVRAWRYSGAEFREAKLFPLNANTLSKRIAGALEYLNELEWLERDTVIELVLPLDTVLTPLDPVQIVIDPGTRTQYRLGHEIPFTLRIAERLTEARWSRRWHSAWSDSSDDRNGNPAVDWLGRDSHYKTSGGWTWLATNDIKDAAEINALRVGLFEGAAFATWCDGPYKEEVRTELQRWTYANVRSLLRQLCDLNKAGKSTVTIVDDAERIPPGVALHTQLIQPTMKGSP